MISRTFSNILSFFRKKSWFFLLLGVFFFLQTQGVFAADPATQTGISAEDSNKLIGYLNGFLQMAAAILGLITGFISIFLYPGWVNGTMFGLQDYLKIIWVLVSNVVYFIFAGILIAIAFMNIIGKTDNNIWELKQAMPKFIVGVLIVPFSWFFIQFLLSLSAILTVGVLTLPYDSFQNEELFSAVLENESDDAIVNQRFCKSIIISLTGSFPEGATSVTEDDGGTFPEQIKCKSEDDKVSIKEIISGEGGGAGLDNNVFGIISVYTYGILKVQERDTLVQADLTTVKGVMDLVFKVIFDLLFVVVYMILMVALFLALMSRGIHLWVYMMLSPLFGLLYFLGKTGKEGFGDTGKNFSIGEFIALAMVPVYVAAALAFGLTFIMVASEGIKEKSSKDDLDTLSAGGFSLSIIGAHGDGEEEKSVIAKLIVQLFGVVILWIAVMAALKSSDVTKNVTQPIQDFGTSVGQLIQKSPTYMPIIPASLGGSAQGLASMGQSFTSTIDTSFKTDAGQKGSAFAEAITGRGSAPTTQLRNQTEPLRDAVGRREIGAMTSTMNALKSQSLSAMSQDKQLRERFVEDLENVIGKDASGNPLLSSSRREAIISASSEQALAQAIADAIKNSNITDANTISAINAAYGANPSAISAQIVKDRMGSTPTPPPVGNTNTFNLNATVVGNALDGNAVTTDTTKLNALRDAIGISNINPTNTDDIRTSILNMIPTTDTDRETKADALISALGL